MNWQIRLRDPSGETRILPLEDEGLIILGRSPSAGIVLRDSTVAQEAAILWPCPNKSDEPGTSPFWLKIPEGATPGFLGDLSIRESHLPVGTPIRIGETQVTLEYADQSSSQPLQPSGVRPWLTETESGNKVLWMTKKAACTPLSIYIAGETGTGKEVLAQMIHAWSDRSSGPFVPLHCGALALSLAESELFGHVKGAFTGADHHRPGALMQAHGGTLFLDEVGDLPMDIQVKLLRFLENGEIRPVGADRPSRAEVRLLCATHLPLEKLVEEGKFRRDLYYRLASVTIEIPTLRSRPEDIKMLAQRFAASLGKNISSKALTRLQAHSWPGNVRELRHAIERASGLAGDFFPILGEEEFEFLVTTKNILTSPTLEISPSILTLHEMERIMLVRALKLSKGNRAKAARILGIARSTLFEMLKRYKIQGPRMSAPQEAAA